MLQRRETRAVHVGRLQIGGGAPVSVQSMTKTFTEDVAATLAQIGRLEEAGCELVRIAVPDERAARAVPEIRRGACLPLVADIHFNPTLALRCLEAGVDGIRINPGFVKEKEILRDIAQLAQAKGAKIRVGVNSGSVAARKGLQVAEKADDLAELMARTALECCQCFEAFGFSNLVVSLKASDPRTTLEANRRFAALSDYPLHLGVTAAGPSETALVKSAALMGALLMDGIGDTIRVSITGDPEYEVEAGFQILQALGLRRRQPEILSCPTCGRTQIGVQKLVRTLQQRLKGYPAWMKVAVMGCIVNGPGEASDADIGITGGKGFGFIFREGCLLRKVREDELIEELMKEVDKLVKERS